MNTRSIRPLPDRIIEARRAAPPAETPSYLFGLVGVLVALLVIFLVGDSIARAVVRPEACRTLTAAECAAAIEERMQK